MALCRPHSEGGFRIFVVAMSLLGVAGLFAIVKALGVANDVTRSLC
jgi:hypothetical protein